MEAYPAGNFVALATYSVVTHDDTTTWVGEGEVEEEEEKEEEEEDGEGEVVHGISVVEITETGPDGSSTTTATTTTTIGPDGTTTEHCDIVRARTPDILEGTDDEDDENVLSPKRSSGLDVPHARHGHEHGHGHEQDAKSAAGATTTSASASTTAATAAAGANVKEEEEDDDTTILFQWEEPVGYLFSHPYSRESVTLHRMGAHEEKSETKKGTEATSKPKRIRLEGGGGGATDHDEETEDEEESKYDHDQWMEKYYIHDCAIHPSWRGQGLASKLWKALEESLTPARDPAGTAGTGASAEGESGASGDLVDTEEESGSDHDGTAAASNDTNDTPTTRRRRGGRGSKKTHTSASSHSSRSHGHHRQRRRKGAPNLKEIVLVSVQGTKPFWQRAGGFEIVADHDMDLSVYGADGEAFLMRKAWRF
jgi:GNAT superfamily N-acetyltransferase